MPDETPPLRTLIVDDEPLAVERMQVLCAGIPALALVGTASDGAAALRLAEALSPDIIFLDIALPDHDGMSVARAIAQIKDANKAPPAIVFVTAYEQFAIEAFDLSATDYLLKPVSPDRLERAIERVHERRARYDGVATAAATYAEEFWIPHRAELIRVTASDIERIDAERDYMRLHIGARSFLLHDTISALEARLDPDLFIRLHRSVMVRKDTIARLGHDKAGAWHAELSNGDIVRVGRTHLSRVKAMVGR